MEMGSGEPDWGRSIAINRLERPDTCRAVLPIMAAQGYGSVVNLGSDVGRVGSYSPADHSASHGGVIALAQGNRPREVPAPGPGGKIQEYRLRQVITGVS